MADILAGFGGFSWAILAFIVALSIIVTVHEYGHYIVGRWCGIKAEVFSLGFGPVLFSRHDKHGTRWQLAALPFGGYVKFLGDANAASQPDGDAVAALSDGDAAKSMFGAALWRRALTVLAGPVFNFVLTIIIFAVIALSRGLPVDEPKIGAIKNNPAGVSELQAGDLILELNGVPVDSYKAFFSQSDTIEQPTVDYLVERKGATMAITGPNPSPALVDRVSFGSAAEDAGLEEGDVIIAVNDAPVATFQNLMAIVAELDGAPMRLTIWRADADGQGATEFDVVLAPRRSDLPLPEGGFETRWLIGISGSTLFEPVLEAPSVWGSVSYGASRVWSIVTGSLSALSHIVSGAISTCNLQGPIGIAETSGNAASNGILDFVILIAVLSTAIGMINLFPIPVLDGGHLLFYAYEAVTGNPPPEKALRLLFAAGMALVLGMMIFSVFNDFLCP